jgi:tripartite-type tricarboxylate transporter receptor subunit TctC
MVRTSTWIASIAVVIASCLPAHAQTYPSRPIRIVVPQAAGGGLDVVVRLVAQELSQKWGQQVVVDNRPGANGIIGLEAVAKSKPDGYTILGGFTSPLTVNPHVYKALPYDTFRDFAPITQLVTNTLVMVVNPNLPVRSVKDFISLAKSHPGEVAYGSFGVGNLTHLVNVLLSAEAGIKMTHVPYKGETPSVTDTIAGQVMMSWATSAGAAPHIHSNRLRLLATGGARRATAWPDTPTMVELGYPNVQVTGWSALLAPAGTAQDIIERFQRDSAQYLLKPDVREKLSAAGAEPVASTTAQFAAFVKSEHDKWGRVVKQAGIYHSQ